MPTPSQASQTTTGSVESPEFDEADGRHRLCGLVHCQHALLGAAGLGLLLVLAVFAVCATLFRWNSDTLVDVTSLAGLTVFLFSGLFAHGAVFVAVKRQSVGLLQPFLILHGFLIVVELTMALTAVGELVTDSEPERNYSFIFARNVLEVAPSAMVLSIFMLYAGYKYRWYLQRRLDSAHGHGANVTPVLFCDPNDPSDVIQKQVEFVT